MLQYVFMLLLQLQLINYLLYSMLNNLINSFQKNKFLNISWSNPCFLCELIKKHHAVKSLRHKNIMLRDEHRIDKHMDMDLFIVLHFMSGINYL